MTARLLDGRALAAETERALAGDVARVVPRLGMAPGLAAVLVGSWGPSVTYVRRKAEACGRVGFRSEVFSLAEESTQEAVEVLIAELSARTDIHGVLLQEPVPAGLDARAALARLDPRKDVDGLTAVSQAALLAGTPGLRPATALGVMALIGAAGMDPAGREAVVVGRSLLVGRPTALLLLAAHATVTVCHSRTPELARHTARAEILVAAAGRPGLITGAMVRPGAVVIDVGITRRDGRLVGDVERASVEPVAGALTPVPGGVGPMTIAMLLTNTWQAFRAQVLGEEAP
ncbi:MAG TPA: bifunctional 5,10-methylenetetrahydrofolate dehydrogenase/5,10-methenyltetrahydrofolate cyclohydrolase [bacterium]|nr:bifunctional 5,10-methylenetetrahydrofolate dehydrogenase/5,10-methenyltetrahydrofolate cyclohydrolase [bacterium]